jgi:hypothetical protein
MKYRKRPVVIEAWPIPTNPDHTQALPPQWLLSSILKGGVIADPKTGCVHIKTLEGEMVGNPGDWIIQGVKGELYPCKPDIFAATYEPETEGDA